jgi:beta-glucosidase
MIGNRPQRTGRPLFLSPFLAAMLFLCLRVTAQSLQQQDAIDRRIDLLLSQMTLEEKAGQLTQFSLGTPTGPGTNRSGYEEMVRKGEVGSLLNAVGAEKTNHLQHIAVDQSRLHIPLLFGFDVIHGQHTIFPINLGMAASFDPALVEQVSRVAAAEARADGIAWVFSPMVDIARDARWGRISESAGEDPYLGSALARAYVRGYQGIDLTAATSVAACVKHFAAYGAPIAGREYNAVDMSQTQLRQVYLPPYQAGIDAGSATVMDAFNALNGVPLTGNAPLLTGILRDEFHFQGLVVSDWDSVGELVPQGVAADDREAAQLALTAGTDMDMESDAYRRYLPQLVRQGQVSVADVDRAVKRVLRVKFALGLFDHPYVPEPKSSYRPTPERRELARRAAEESFVLLKNDRSRAPLTAPTGAAEEVFGTVPKHALLPLDAKTHATFALIGPLADASAQMLGSWALEGDPADVRTLRAELASRLPNRLLYAQGTGFDTSSRAGFSAALEAARKADVVILALGEDGPVMTGEGASRTRLDLPGNQESLLEAVSAVGKPIVLLVFSGRPLALPWAARHIPAILAVWFPGIEAGPAIAATLFGEAAPSGHLPVEFPYAVGQEPLFLAQLPTGRPALAVDLSHAPSNSNEKPYSRYIDEYNKPVFPFGWGLSYTAFAYGPISAQAAPEGATVNVSVDVTNIGGRDGEDVVQLYFRRRVAPVAQPVRELKGFARIPLKAGKTKKVLFQLTQADIAFYRGDQLMTGIDGDFDIWIGDSSAATNHFVLSSRSGKFVANAARPGGGRDDTSAGPD